MKEKNWLVYSWINISYSEFLPGLVAPRVGVVTHRTGLTIDCVLYCILNYCLVCVHFVRYGVITFTVTLSICCQNFICYLYFPSNPVYLQAWCLSYVLKYQSAKWPKAKSDDPEMMVYHRPSQKAHRESQKSTRPTFKGPWNCYSDLLFRPIHF